MNNDKHCSILDRIWLRLAIFCATSLRPWQNYQTLLVKHLIFASQVKCLTVWLRPKTLLFKHFLFASNKKCFGTFSKTLRNQFCYYCLSSNVFGHGQTVKHLLYSKFKMLDQQCLIVRPGPNLVCCKTFRRDKKICFIMFEEHFCLSKTKTWREKMFVVTQTGQVNSLSCADWKSTVCNEKDPLLRDHKCSTNNF